MKNLKLTLVALIVLTAPFISYANDDDKKPKEKKDKIERLRAKLDLSEEQVEKLKAIDAKYKAKKEELKAKMEPLKDQMKVLKEEKRATMKAQGDEMEQILTAEQLAKFEEMKKAHMEKRKAKKGEKMHHQH